MGVGSDRRADGTGDGGRPSQMDWMTCFDCVRRMKSLVFVLLQLGAVVIRLYDNMVDVVGHKQIVWNGELREIQEVVPLAPSVGKYLFRVPNQICKLCLTTQKLVCPTAYSLNFRINIKPTEFDDSLQHGDGEEEESANQSDSDLGLSDVGSDHELDGLDDGRVFI